MKHLSFGFACLMVVAVSAERKNSTKNDFHSLGSDEDRKFLEKRSEIQENQNWPTEPTAVGSSKGTQERAKQERTFKDFSGYEAIQDILIKTLNPKPIVDTAEESEKLAPNYGSKAEILGDLIVRGTESFSRVLNSVIDVPKKAISSFSKGATQALNQLGAYLVGL